MRLAQEQNFLYFKVEKVSAVLCGHDSMWCMHRRARLQWQIALDIQCVAVMWMQLTCTGIYRVFNVNGNATCSTLG